MTAEQPGPARINDLRVVPGYGPVIADRIWNAWWRLRGEPLSAVVTALEGVNAAIGFPSFTLVACEGDAFLGTVTVIAHDVEGRPDLTPCIAALWVEESARNRGIGGALLRAAAEKLHDRGFTKAYLAAREPLRDYYSGRGWTLLESGVGEDDLDVFCRALP